MSKIMYKVLLCVLFLTHKGTLYGRTTKEIQKYTSVQTSVHPSVIHPSVFLFPDDNLSEYQWFFVKLGMCIGIMEIWFGNANVHILSIF